MVLRENENNAYAKFWREKQSIMIFLEPANCSNANLCFSMKKIFVKYGFEDELKK